MDSDDLELTYPIGGIAGCCARAASGRAATPCRMRWTKRPVRVLVLPEPGPASVS
jgi:hypothetical protein